MLLYLMRKYLKCDYNNFYKLNRLSDMSMYSSMINSFISSLIMDYDFDSYGSLNFANNEDKIQYN